MTETKSVAYENKRNLLFLNLNNDKFQWIDKFNTINWNCIQSHTVKDAIARIKTNEINVAIAMISSKCHQRVFEALEGIFKANTKTSWIAISCENHILDYQTTHQFSKYFFDYHHLPIDWARLQYSLGHAYGMSILQSESSGRNVKSQHSNNEILGHSPAIRHLKSALNKVSKVDTTVLISGETGTGKGLCARWIHDKSNIRNGPFISVNCGALPTNLIHSELFGYDKGAFTGASKTYIGHIERANKGTLFLDEIGDLSIESQIHLLHFLDDHTIERLGGSHRRTIDCRIIFASHVNLEEAVEKGVFREDLFHRLNILRINVPSLKEHKEDIEILSQTFITTLNPTTSEATLSISAINAMLQYDWPGNIRELKNRIQRALIMADSQILTEHDLGLKLNENNINKANSIIKPSNINTEALIELISRNNNNISAAARELKISRTTFYRLIKKSNICIHPD